MEAKIKTELVFIPSPGRGHLLATLEMAKLLVDRDQRLSITVLIIQPFNDPKSTTAHSYNSNDSNPDSKIRFVDLPKVIEPQSNPIAGFFTARTQFISSHKNHVRNEVTKIVHSLHSNNSKLGGFVVDMFCTGMIDVANEFNVPTYVFFTSGASMLGLMLHFQGLLDYQNQDLTVYNDSNDVILIPSYESPVPAKLVPQFIFDEDSNQVFMDLARSVRQTKGVIVNTFFELETFAIKFFSDDEKSPSLYPVGPILHVDSRDDRNSKYGEIMKWLDEQPDSSVVFLCFGSKGCFDEAQVKEIALALENSRHRFLWSLRKPPGENKHETPGEYESPDEVLPKGFIQRTLDIGKVIGWAPQVAVLSHRAVGGFVSHCGWNSTLESIWCGVPMAVWPLYAEQSTNAFQLVRELGVAVEINMEYKYNFMGANMIVRADEIENGIRLLMEKESDVRVKIGDLKVKSRMAVVENGSSFEFVGRFINDVMGNMD